MKQKISLILFLGLLVLNSLLVTFLILELPFGQKQSFSELEELKNSNFNFVSLSNFFSDVADKKGAEYSYDLLKIAELSPNIDLHLLGHIIGDILYKQEGVEGIKICDPDFRNACSHSIVIGLFNENGEGALGEVSEACRQAPGGKGAYGMCFHGLGHGVLAFTQYEMPEAVELCKKTGTEENNYREYIECVGGVTMEMVGGVHDRELWQEKYLKYTKEDDPLYPCSAEFIPDDVRFICYTHLTPQLLTLGGANLGFPQPLDYKNAFPFCNLLPPEDIIDREACYGGFGKEFVVIAQDRDIRKIDQMTDEQLGKVYDWCSLADNKDGVEACIGYASNSLYWGGENDRVAAVNFCNLITDRSLQSSCFGGLTANVSYYIDDRDYKVEYCNEVPGYYREVCENRLL